MNTNNPSTQTYTPPEGGFTKEQQAEYDALRFTEAELAEILIKKTAE